MALVLQVPDELAWCSTGPRNHPSLEFVTPRLVARHPDAKHNAERANYRPIDRGTKRVNRPLKRPLNLPLDLPLDRAFAWRPTVHRWQFRTAFRLAHRFGVRSQRGLRERYAKTGVGESRDEVFCFGVRDDDRRGADFRHEVELFGE